MGTVMIPNLTMTEALQFCDSFDDYIWEDENIFDFSKVSRCEPFAMLIIGLKIRNARKQRKECCCLARNTNNSYAETMRFYRFVGISKGKSFDLEYGNKNYQPISELDLLSLMKKSRQENRAIGDVVTGKAEKMATVLSHNNVLSKKVMTFLIREMIRNIPEHSNSYEGWYCAQFWPSDDIVELALIDNGCGILYSLNSNINYASQFLNNREALIKALEPGVSAAFNDNGDGEIFKSGTMWQNSGYGLFVVSRLCAKLDASFVIASGDTAIEVYKDQEDQIAYRFFKTSVPGTAIRMRFKVSSLQNTERAMQEIRELAKHDKEDAFKNASIPSFLKF